VTHHQDDPQPLRVLVVDDCPDAADSQAILLQLRGYEVRVAYGGSAALEVARSFLPRVVLCDLGMPVMDGCAVAVRLREALAGRPLLLIALTAYDDPDDHDRTRAAGFRHHLVKPADPGEVERLVASWRGGAAAGT
jgi:CheY-like chemotaxis protein